MKKNIIIISITVLTITALTLFVAQIKNKPSKPNKQAEHVVISETKQAELNVSTPQKTKIASEEINKIEQYAKEFNMPAELKEELVEAVKKGTVDTQWGENEISKKEIDEAGLSLNKLAKQTPDSKTENVAAGYIVNGTKFKKILAACKPAAKNDNEQVKELKKQALEELGFNALADDNKKQIEEIISQNESMEMPRVPMIDLEYALLLLEQGRKDEALKIIDEAIAQNQDDKEFVEIAKALRENINKYE